MKKLIAYHGKQSIKDDLIAQLEAHYAADEIIAGIYWEFGKGCAVGCTVHSANHADYESMYGIPAVLAYLEDGIFESLPKIRQKRWPLQFAKSINVGADLSRVWPKFAVFLLTDKIHGVIKYAESDDQRMAIQQVSDLYSSNDIITIKQWQEAADSADSAARAARTSRAAYAADSAARASRAARAACAGNSEKKHRIAQSKKLLQLLSECH